MNRINKAFNACCIAIALAFVLPVGIYAATPDRAVRPSVSASAPIAELWHDPGNIGSLNLLYGAGGKKHLPSGTFTFEKEDMNGTSPKFDVVDGQGVHWKVKLGAEPKSETAATRLVWAAGYHVDEDYFLPTIRVEKLPKLHRGQKFVSAGGVVRDVRLERKIKGVKKDGNWSWFKNPFVGTTEMDGLRIMMALTNNWDLKEINNSIYEVKGEEPEYLVSDLGATFGKTGNPFTRSKSKLRDYRRTRFVQKIGPTNVDFFMSSRPFFLAAFDVPNYITRTKMQSVAKHIPRSSAKWLGRLLGQLSADQIRDCFRGAGYSPEEVEGYTTIIQSRIADLNRL